MATIEVHLPDDIAEYGPDLQLVFTLAIRKLYANRHKGWGGANSNDLIALEDQIHKEAEELRKALLGEPQFSAVIEAIDVMNMGALMAIALLRLPAPEFRAASWRGKPE